MNMGVPRWSILAVLCFISAGCHTGVLEKDTSFQIVATEAGFDAPERVASGMRHIVFENHGSEIHEAMLVKLPPGMSPSDYVTTVANDAVPKDEAVLKLVDYRFEIEGNLRRGPQVIRVETPGPTMHEVDFFRLHDGKTVADLKRWRKENLGGPAPADAFGGALDSHDLKRVVWLRKEFSPGRYVLHCEMPLTTDTSAPHTDITHADLGLVREFEIKE